MRPTARTTSSGPGWRTVASATSSRYPVASPHPTPATTTAATLPPDPDQYSDLSRWLLIRRSITNPDDLAFYLCFGPTGTPDDELVRVAGTRWAIEECFQTAKAEIEDGGERVDPREEFVVAFGVLLPLVGEVSIS
jgi:hypothetical protein